MSFLRSEGGHSETMRGRDPPKSWFLVDVVFGWPQVSLIPQKHSPESTTHFGVTHACSVVQKGERMGEFHSLNVLMLFFKYFVNSGSINNWY